MKWWKIFVNWLGKTSSMIDLSFIPRDEITGNINTTKLTQAYVLKTSDGTKVSIAIKIDGKWLSIPYDPQLDTELSECLGEAYSEILIDEWARILSEYGSIIEPMDEKFKQISPQASSKQKLG